MDATAVDTAQMVQMNVRIGKALKAQGDAALRQAGYLPSQAVRAIWGYAAAQADDVPALRKTLRELEGLESREDNDHARLSIAEAGSHLVDDALSSHGFSKRAIAQMGGTDGSDESLKEHAAWERLASRGLA